MASKIIRSGNSPLRNLIRHLRLSPSITPTPAVVYNQNYLFPPTVVPRVESNQTVVKSPKGDEFAVWAFTGLGHRSGVNVHCRTPKFVDDDNMDFDSDLSDSDFVIEEDFDVSDVSDVDVRDGDVSDGDVE